jgi:hypothetical protein
MRWNETKDGIPVTDKDGKQVGVSAEAGKQAVFLTALSRMALSAPILLLPPTIMHFVNKVGAIARNKRIRIPIEILVISGSLWGALPFATAIFPQVVELPVAKLEPQFQGLRDAQGKPVESLFCNKGV